MLSKFLFLLGLFSAKYYSRVTIVSEDCFHSLYKKMRFAVICIQILLQVLTRIRAEDAGGIYEEYHIDRWSIR